MIGGLTREQMKARHTAIVAGSELCRVTDQLLGAVIIQSIPSDDLAGLAAYTEFAAAMREQAARWAAQHGIRLKGWDDD